MRLSVLALVVSLVPITFFGIGTVVRMLVPYDHEPHETLAVAIMGLSCVVLLLWPAGLGLSVFALRQAGTDVGPRRVARVALGVGIVQSVLLAVGCVAFSVLVWGLSLR
jgi:hypothetical protein